MIGQLKSLVLRRFFQERLVEQYTPLTLGKGTVYEQKQYGTQKDLAGELLDPKPTRDVVFTWYEGFTKQADFSLLESLRLKSSLLVVHPKKIGREFAKTTLFSLSEEDEPRSAILQILNGEGIVYYQNQDASTRVKVTYVKQGDVIYIPKDQEWELINTDDTENFVALVVTGIGVIWHWATAKQQGGAAHFYTKKGFVKNGNCKQRVTMIEHTGSVPGPLKTEEGKPVYELMLERPEFFSFLNY